MHAADNFGREQDDNQTQPHLQLQQSHAKPTIKLCKLSTCSVTTKQKKPIWQHVHTRTTGGMIHAPLVNHHQAAVKIRHDFQYPLDFSNCHPRAAAAIRAN
jgi:hypothetical protein